MIESDGLGRSSRLIRSADRRVQTGGNFSLRKCLQTKEEDQERNQDSVLPGLTSYKGLILCAGPFSPDDVN